jgi:hypothetical protein
LETHGTLFHGTRVSVDLIVHVIGCLAEGLGIRGTARVFEADPNTVLQWLVEAADQLRAFSRHVLHDVRVRQVQLDELRRLGAQHGVTARGPRSSSGGLGRRGGGAGGEKGLWNSYPPPESEIRCCGAP